MGKGDYLGEFEQIVLLALHRLKQDAYGMNIRRDIETRSGREVTIGAVYATLDRLEHKGYVSSGVGEPTAARGGKAKRFYALEPTGAEALQNSRDILARMWDGLSVEIP